MFFVRSAVFSSVSTRKMIHSTDSLLNEFTSLLKALHGHMLVAYTFSRKERRKSACWKTNLSNEQFTENQIISTNFVSYYQEPWCMRCYRSRVFLLSKLSFGFCFLAAAVAKQTRISQTVLYKIKIFLYMSNYKCNCVDCYDLEAMG